MAKKNVSFERTLETGLKGALVSGLSGIIFSIYLFLAFLFFGNTYLQNSTTFVIFFLASIVLYFVAWGYMASKIWGWK